MKARKTTALPKGQPNLIRSLVGGYVTLAQEQSLEGVQESGPSVSASIENMMRANMSAILAMLVEAREIKFLTAMLGASRWKYFSEQLELPAAYVRDCLQIAALFKHFGLQVSDCGTCLLRAGGASQITLLDITDTTLRELVSRKTPNVVRTHFMELLLSGQRVLRKDVRAMVEEYHRYRDPGPMPGTV